MAIIIDPISPVAFSILGMPVRWYALAYIAGFVLGYWLFKKMMLSPKSSLRLDKKQLDDLLTYVIMGVVIGGRLGYVLFYNPAFFIAHPLEILALWHGGMSFHGGLVGVLVATWLFARKNSVRAWSVLDMMAVVAPIGLLCGRIANFINMEVMGRPTDVPWAVVFNGETIIPRHPSPIYEAFGEGVLLFALMAALYRWTNIRHYPSALCGIWGMFYAVARIVCEQFRAPDAQIGFLTSWGLTMGTLLSAIMFVAGAIIFVGALRKK